jgi:hypothetical protein
VRRTTWGRVALIATIGLLGILVPAPGAFGQAAIDQYIPSGDPSGDPGDSAKGGSSGGSGPTGFGATGSGAGGAPLSPQGAGIREGVSHRASSGSTAGVNVPATDYPVTPFIAIVAVLLGAGLVARLIVWPLGRRLSSVELD